MDIKFKMIVLINLISEMRAKRKLQRKVKQAEREVLFSKKELEKQQERIERLLSEFKTINRINSRRKAVR